MIFPTKDGKRRRERRRKEGRKEGRKEERKEERKRQELPVFTWRVYTV